MDLDILNDFVGKYVNIVILKPSENKRWFFTATIIKVGEEFIYFIDKFGRSHSFKISDIEEISEYVRNKNED